MFSSFVHGLCNSFSSLPTNFVFYALFLFGTLVLIAFVEGACVAVLCCRLLRYFTAIHDEFSACADISSAAKRKEKKIGINSHHQTQMAIEQKKR